MRPDRWGIIADPLDIPGEKVKLLYIWECIEGRYRSIDIQELLEKMVQTGKYVIAGWLMDGTRDTRVPPNMTAEDVARFSEAVQKFIRDKNQEAKAVGA